MTHPPGWDESREDVEPSSADDIIAKATGVLSPLGSWDLPCAGPHPTGYHPVDVLVMYTPNIVSPPPTGYGSVAALTAAVQSALDADVRPHASGRGSVGISVLPEEVCSAPLRWAQRYYNPSGGHYAAWEEPQAIITDVRDFFRALS